MFRKIFSRIKKIKYKLDGSIGSFILINFFVNDYNAIGINAKNNKKYLTSLDTIQLDKSFFDTKAARFFKERTVRE